MSRGVDNVDAVVGLKRLKSGSVDLTVTSPPYDSLRDYDSDVPPWSGDVWRSVLSELFRVSALGGVVVWIVSDKSIDGSESGTSFRQALYAKDLGFRLHDTMIWRKDGFSEAGSLQTRYGQVFEYMFVFSKGKPKTFNAIKDRRNLRSGKVSKTARRGDGSIRVCQGANIGTYGVRFNVWDQASVKNNTSEGHPAPFPLRLAVDHVRTWSNKGDTVLDPFLGSGTTGVACRQLERDFIGFEISRRFYEMAVARIERSTAQANFNFMTE